MMRIICLSLVTPALALALAACGAEAEQDAPSPEALDSAPAAAPDSVPVTQADPAVSDTASETAAAANTIPARFQGVWDYEGGTCAPESDLRMEISASEILFYESIGLVTGVTADKDAVIVTLAMEGEGETWEQSTRFALMGEGEDLRIHTSEGDGPMAPDEYPSKRCPE
ncbi:hypothetical protein FGU71_08155 [Erythrobacter insulae]|uniref:Copper resistance protein NlpE n=1 Tax=Erythrobacter insulae TaxID=2584124 RepID=A0A547PCI0_9SPHN|nr:hypothetical protein [Erythrobacter insulae]TRD11830.1 hypothetical protein FGU71_08155 [Erythrobacter insulae]